MSDDDDDDDECCDMESSRTKAGVTNGAPPFSLVVPGAVAAFFAAAEVSGATAGEEDGEVKG